MRRVDRIESLLMYNHVMYIVTTVLVLSLYPGDPISVLGYST